MSKAEDIREWIRDHPGQHTASEINTGLGLQGRVRYLYSYALKTLVEHEEVMAEGHAKQRRYWLRNQS